MLKIIDNKTVDVQCDRCGAWADLGPVDGVLPGTHVQPAGDPEILTEDFDDALVREARRAIGWGNDGGDDECPACGERAESHEIEINDAEERL